jgi:hypothetical protein
MAAQARALANIARCLKRLTIILRDRRRAVANP